MKILFAIGCRSDEGLVMPVIRRCEADPVFEVKTIRLHPMNFIESYRIAEDAIKEFKPDLFFANADRVEMCGATAAAFHNKVKIAHYQAGVVNDPITTFDDIDRHVITLWSDIQFCENKEAASVVYDLKSSYITHGLMDIKIVGITHLDDLEVDESKVPYYFTEFGTRKTIYNLILYNTPTVGDYRQDIETIKGLIKDASSILVSGNPDGDAESILAEWVDEFHIDLPRPQFMGLLKNCERFITNSSCAVTEAPYFLKPDQIVMIGDRNRNRPAVVCKSGGSDRIVAILKEYANAHN